MATLNQLELDEHGREYQFDPTVMIPITAYVDDGPGADAGLADVPNAFKEHAKAKVVSQVLTALGLRKADNGQVQFKVGGKVLMGRTMRELPVMEEDAAAGESKLS